MYRIPFFILLTACWVMPLSPAKAQQIQRPDSAYLVADIELHARATYIKALEATESGEYRQALKLLTAAYKQLGKSAGANYTLADTYLHLDRPADALHYAQKAIRLDSTNKWYQLKLVDIYEAAERNDDALQQLEIIRSQYPYDTVVLSRLAKAYVDADELQKAHQQYNQLLKLQGASIPLYLQKAKLFSRLSMPDSLSAQLSNIKKMHPRKPSTFKLLSNYYRTLGDSMQANIMAQKAGDDVYEDQQGAIKQAPAGREARSQHIRALLDQQQFKEARDMALKANEQFPQDAFFNFAAGRAWLGQGEPSKAVEWLDKASKLPARKPLKITILNTLGDAYAALHQPDKAKTAYKQALELDPDNPRLKEKMYH